MLIRDNLYLLRVFANIAQKMEIRARLSNCGLDRDQNKCYTDNNLGFNK